MDNTVNIKCSPIITAMFRKAYKYTVQYGFDFFHYICEVCTVFVMVNVLTHLYTNIPLKMIKGVTECRDYEHTPIMLKQEDSRQMFYIDDNLLYEWGEGDIEHGVYLYKYDKCQNKYFKFISRELIEQILCNKSGNRVIIDEFTKYWQRV